jgi:hypothetical protein
LGFWIIGAKQKILGGVKCKKHRAIGENFKIPGSAVHPLTCEEHRPCLLENELCKGSKYSCIIESATL